MTIVGFYLFNERVPTALATTDERVNNKDVLLQVAFSGSRDKTTHIHTFAILDLKNKD